MRMRVCDVEGKEEKRMKANIVQFHSSSMCSNWMMFRTGAQENRIHCVNADFHQLFPVRSGYNAPRISYESKGCDTIGL
jgi:hypothetical protein